MIADDTFQLTDALIAELQTMDTPTVCTRWSCWCPSAVVTATPPNTRTARVLSYPSGLARTASIRAAHPGDLNSEAAALSDAYYAYIDEGPKPSIVVMQDLDGDVVWQLLGEVNSNVHKGFGSVGR